MKKKIAYVALSADILHEGHINILKTASKLGNVVVGLLTDEAISTYKKIPYLDFKQRKTVIQNIKYVTKVIPQKTLDYVPNLKYIKPDFVVHGDDWKTGIQKKTRGKVIKILKKWSGKLVEPKYTKNISSSKIKEKLEFDGMWSSSLTDSLTRGKPDNQAVDYSTRISGLNEILDVTTKPLIFDADNGGRLEHISYLVKTLERAGVSAVVFEDKIGLKKNSLFEDQKKTKQDLIKNFCKKITKAKNAKISDDLMIVARIESFILGKGLSDAIKRAEAYSKAGADAILIHSKEKNPKEIFSFSKKFNKSKFKKPLIAVPSTYSKTSETMLIKNGFKIVIYANHLLRASYPAMQDVAKKILLSKRSFEVEKKISPIKEIISLIK